MADIMNRFKVEQEQDEFGGSVKFCLDGKEVFTVVYGPTVRSDRSEYAMLEAFQYDEDEKSAYRLEKR